MTRKLMIAALSAAVFAGSFGTAAFAKPGDRGDVPPMARPGLFIFMLKNFDANKDGKVTVEEAKAGADTLFAAIDTDKDGSITPKEMKTWRQAKMAEMRKAMGNDAPPAPDQGGPDEQADAGPDAGTPDAPPPGKHHGMKGMRHHGKGHHGMMGGGLIRMLDTDENGQVSKAEAEAGAENLVKQMDTNKDGAVSIDDFPG